jgi:hypothetical protein
VPEGAAFTLAFNLGEKQARIVSAHDAPRFGPDQPITEIKRLEDVN